MSILPAPINYAARDQAIARQTYSVVRKLDGLPQEIFALYWRDVHGPLCARLPGLGYYVQHHFSREHRANLWPLPEGVPPMQVELDGAVEIGFADAQAEARFIAESPVLFGDEFNLFAHAVAYNLPHGSRTLVDRSPDGVPNGPDRLYRLHLHLGGAGDAAFRSWLTAWAERLAGDPAVLKLRLHLPETYDNAHPAPPSPIVDHQVGDDRKAIGVIELGFASALTARACFAGDAYRSTAAEQRKHLRAAAAFLVTGIYTYIRDGVMTTAGLRGSRTAQLIAEIGAVNQTQDDVTRRFVEPRRA